MGDCAVPFPLNLIGHPVGIDTDLSVVANLEHPVGEPRRQSKVGRGQEVTTAEVRGIDTDVLIQLGGRIDVHG